MISVATFRADFPEFTNEVTFPSSSIQYYINLAGLLLNTDRWGIGKTVAAAPPTTILDMGSELFVAHNVALEARAAQEAASGGVPGGTVGPVASKGVDKVNVSYDTQAGLDPKDGHWNLTTYGLRFIQLAKMRGMGPIYVAPGCDPFGATGLNGPAWTGPFSGGLWN